MPALLSNRGRLVMEADSSNSCLGDSDGQLNKKLILYIDPPSVFLNIFSVHLKTVGKWKWTVLNLLLILEGHPYQVWVIYEEGRDRSSEKCCKIGKIKALKFLDDSSSSTSQFVTHFLLDDHSETISFQLWLSLFVFLYMRKTRSQLDVLRRTASKHFRNLFWNEGRFTGQSVLQQGTTIKSLLGQSGIIISDMTVSQPPPIFARLPHRLGTGRGVRGRDNSCYLDALLFALFYDNHRFDEVLLKQPLADDPERRGYGDGVRSKVQKKLREISQHLRTPPDFYCGDQDTMTLRTHLSTVNPRMLNCMVDVEELVTTLFGRTLRLAPFIRYVGNTKNFIHTIILPPPQHKIEVGQVQICLENSLVWQDLKFAAIPNPVLMIKMPRSNGRLIGYKKIVPNPVLRVLVAGNFADGHQDDRKKGSTILFDLRAVICLCHSHYTTLTRNPELGHWLYFDSMSLGGEPEVTEVTQVEQEIHDLLRNSCDTHFGLSRMLNHLVTDAHLCIYVPRLSPSETTGNFWPIQDRLPSIMDSHSIIVRTGPCRQNPNYDGTPMGALHTAFLLLFTSTTMLRRHLQQNSSYFQPENPEVSNLRDLFENVAEMYQNPNTTVPDSLVKSEAVKSITDSLRQAKSKILNVTDLAPILEALFGDLLHFKRFIHYTQNDDYSSKFLHEISVRHGRTGVQPQGFGVKFQFGATLHESLCQKGYFLKLPVPALILKMPFPKLTVNNDSSHRSTFLPDLVIYVKTGKNADRPQMVLQTLVCRRAGGGGGKFVMYKRMWTQRHFWEHGQGKLEWYKIVSNFNSNHPVHPQLMPHFEDDFGVSNTNGTGGLKEYIKNIAESLHMCVYVDPSVFEEDSKVPEMYVNAPSFLTEVLNYVLEQTVSPVLETIN